MRPHLLALLLLGPALVGCLGSDDAPAGEPASTGSPASSAASTPPTVIAVPDTGFNPYHEAFQGGPTFADVPGFPDHAEAVNVTRGAGSYDAAVEADGAAWSQVGEEDLVWFPGTRLAGISFGAEVNGSFLEAGPVGDDVRDPPAPILDVDGHGTLTSHSAITASNHTVVIGIQVPDDEHLPEAMTWIADQEWIDLVSVSWGTWAFEYPQGEARMGLPSAYRAVFDSGKLVFNGVGNTPKAHVTQEHSGPPFVVAVGGSIPDSQGESALASKLPDIVAPFVQTHLAEAQTLDGYTTSAGTSLSTPYAVGAVAEALWQARQQADATVQGIDPALAKGSGPGAFEDGRLEAEELWAATNASAVQWGATDWQPDAEPNILGASLPVAHPAVQMGWGEVTPNATDRIAAQLLGQGETAEKAPGTATIMERVDDAARAFWSSPAGQPPPAPPG